MSVEISPYAGHHVGVDNEEILTGGNVAAEVVRIGSTVRKPALAHTAGVEAVLEHLAAKHFDGAPRTLGLDDRGRHVLEYIPGTLADTLPPFSIDDLRRLGRADPGTPRRDGDLRTAAGRRVAPGYPRSGRRGADLPR